MDIDDPVGKLIDEVSGNLGQEACEDDVVTSANGMYHEPGLVNKLLTCDNSRRHSELFGAHKSIGIAAAGHHNGYLHFRFI